MHWHTEKNFSVGRAKLVQDIHLFTAQFKSPPHDSLTHSTNQANTAPKLSRIVPQMLLILLLFFHVEFYLVEI